jgi:hypothetical protein
VGTVGQPKIDILKMNKSKILLAVLLGITTFFTSLFGQNIDSLNIDSIFVKSYIDNNQEKYSFHYSVVSYENFVDVLILPTEQARAGESIEVEIFDNSITSIIRSVAFENSDVVRISNLMKNKEYSIRVFKTDAVRGRHMVNSNLNTISTTKGSEFRVSNKFYKAISRWSSFENQTQKLISFLKENSDNVNLYEIAAFIQDHYKTGDISDNFAGNIAAFVNNPPMPIHTGSGNPEERTSKCNCSLILNTHRYANTPDESYSGSPEETNYLAIGNGAAKTMLLSMVGKHGSGKYEANIGGVVSPLYAIISYNLVCSDYYSDLPEECMCPKKILYDYSYTARLTTKAKKGGGAWIWSAGAEATAEDYAALTIRNGGTVTAADAGRVRISSNCNSSWNSGWWTQAAIVLVSAAGVAIDTNATIASWANLLPQVVTLFSTNFFNKSGDCTDKNEVNTLMAGSGELTMTTNKPVDILISSLGYEYVRGFGKWESRSTIVSDYHLAVVLLGQDQDRPECCTPNVADFHIGNFEDWILKPFNIKILDGSVNSDSNLKGKVNRLFTLWGPWPGLVRDAYGNYILDGDFGHFVRTFPDCAPIDPLQDEDTELRSKSSSNEMTVYPNPVTDFMQIEHKNLTEISIINLQGQVMHKQNVDSRVKSFSIDVSNLLSGQYFIMAKDDKEQYYYTKFQKI